MNNYTLIAGVNGTGKSSLRGVLEGQGAPLGHIIDANAIANENNFDNLRAGKQAVSEIQFCLENNISFTQETTLSGTEPNALCDRQESRATMLRCITSD